MDTRTGQITMSNRPPTENSLLPVKDSRLQPPDQWPQPRRNNPFHLPIWAMLLTLMMVCGMVACIVVAVLALGGHTPAEAPPRFVIVTAEASLTPIITLPPLAVTAVLPPLQAADSAPVLAGPTLPPIVFTATPTTPPRIGVGSTIEVVGTDGIRIRDSAGTDNAANVVLTIANPGEHFSVIEGPLTANGLTWWRIQNADATVIGWAAESDGVQTLLQVIAP
jgi:hypothetical protein